MVGTLRFAHPTAACNFVGWAKALFAPCPPSWLVIQFAMSQYRRAKIEGNVLFFTVVLAERPSNLLFEEIERLRQSYRTVQQRRPFETVAVWILPDHIHALWAVPEGDADFSTRWSLIKSGFSRGLDARKRSVSKITKREKGIWQRRYWEHAIRDDADFERHVDYIHFNPV